VTPGAHIRYLGEELGGIAGTQGLHLMELLYLQDDGQLARRQEALLERGAQGFLQGASDRSRNSLTEPLVSDESKESNLVSSPGM
jgi:hypothetical protein